MRDIIARIVIVSVALATAVSTVLAAPKLRVVATTPDLAAFAQAVGGSLAEVDVLGRGTQNMHEVEVRPSLMLKLRRADILIENGLELDRWVELVAQGANNPNVVRGAAGVIDASRGIPVLEVPTVRVDRSMGDVHPLGNPHYTLDPALVPMVTQTIVDGFARIAGEHRGDFERNREKFVADIEKAMKEWTRAMEPFRGTKVIVYHPQWIYFLHRFGLEEAGWVEERPGIPPSPGHLVRLIRQMKDEGIKVVIYAPWNDQKLAERVAEEAGAKAVLLAQMVGGVKGADTYVAAIDHNVKALAQALRAPR